MKDIDISRQKIWDDGGFKEITIEFADEYNTKLDNSNIYNESVELTETLCDESNIKYGKCSANCFKVTIFNDSTISHKGIKIHPKLTINPNTDNADTIELGYYTIESEEKSSDKMYRNIVAYDDMYKIANTDVAEWYNGLTFPMTIKAFRDSFFTWFGITQKETTLPLDSLSISKTLDVKTISGLSVIESICELNGCFGNINWDGQFEYIYISSEDDALYPDDELYPSDDLYAIGNFDLYLNKSDYVQGSLTYEDYTSQALTSVTIRNSQDEAGATYPTVTDPKTNYVITNNFLVSDKGTETLSAIAEKFYLENNDVSYTPFSIKTFAKPWAELGDNANIITNDGAIKTVILKRTLRGITALFDSLSASGEPNFSNSINSIANDIENLKGKSNILTRTLEETRSEITDLETNTSSSISQLSNQISAKVDNGDYTASIIIGKINDDTPSGVQIDADKINLNGYVTVTDLKTSGQTIINGSNITTGKISASVVDTDNLVVKNGDFTKSFSVSVPTTIGSTFDISADSKGGTISHSKSGWGSSYALFGLSTITLSATSEVIVQDALRVIGDTIVAATGASGVYVECTNGEKVSLHATPSNTNHGLYSNSRSKWIAYMNSSGTTLTTTSDKRAKIDKGVLDSQEAIDILKNMNIVKFVMKDDVDENNLEQCGLYAQELRDFLIANDYLNRGYIVLQNDDSSTSYDITKEETDSFEYAIDYSKFIPTLIKGWQEQQKEIDELKNEVNELKSMINNIRKE